MNHLRTPHKMRHHSAGSIDKLVSGSFEKISINGISHMHGLNVYQKNGLTPKENITYLDVENTAQHLLSLTYHRPQIAIVCGSGLGGMVDMLQDPFAIAYEHIPHFPVSTAPGHEGKLVFGKLEGKSCVCMQGRVHLYEGYPAWKVVFPIRVLNAMKVEILICTNASGAVNENYQVGDLMMTKDHINLPGLCGMNPLLGPNDERFGPRFPALSDAYDIQLRELCREAAQKLKFDFVHEGVYCIQSGPCYETVTECRFLKLLGADVLGMSTVPEVVAARHVGLRCFSLSLVTNSCVMEYDSKEIANSDEVLQIGKLRSMDCQKLISKMVSLIPITSVD